MKYLLVMALVLGVFWMWRHNRHVEREEKEEARDKAKRQAAVQKLLPVDMVACAVCGVHLPKSEALRSADSYFCGDAHRRQAGI